MRALDVATYAEGHEFNLTGPGEPVRLAGTFVSAELFSVLNARPEKGRTFYPGEDAAGQDNYVVLSHQLWEQRFAGDSTIIGRSIELEGVNRQVVGVMPESFRFPSAKTELWIPLHNDPRSVYEYWAGDFMPVVGRLHRDVGIAEARGEIRGGRFVDGFLGEQFALPVAVESLRATRKLPPTGELVTISAADPLNLVGVVVPGERIPAISGRYVSYRDGVAVEAEVLQQSKVASL